MVVMQSGVSVPEAASNPVRVRPAVRAGLRHAREAAARGWVHRLPATPGPNGSGSRDGKQGPPVSIKTLCASRARRTLAHRMFLRLRVLLDASQRLPSSSPAHPTHGTNVEPRRLVPLFQGHGLPV